MLRSLQTLHYRTAKQVMGAASLKRILRRFKFFNGGILAVQFERVGGQILLHRS